MGYKESFIDLMVSSGVLTFGDFITKSGRKTPYFINTGNYKNGEQISKLGDYYAEAVFSNFGGDFEAFFGPAYKGIPLAVAAASSFYRKYSQNKSFCFNRKEEKDHGEGGNIIGYKPADGDRVIILEDVITAGTSVRESIPLLKSAADVTVMALIVSVDRMEKGESGKSALKEAQDLFGLKAASIVTIDEIVNYLYKRETGGRVILDDKMKDRIDEYRKSYGV